jgi:hypothetical protein
MSDICAFCGDKEGVVPFHVSLSNQAVGVGERRSATLSLSALACDRCSPRLGAFKRLRIIFLLTLLAAGALLLEGMSQVWTHPALGLLMIAAAIIGVTVTLIPTLRWHRRTAQALLSDDMRAALLRRLPDLGGVIAWQQVRIFPGTARNAVPIAELRTQRPSFARRRN